MNDAAAAPSPNIRRARFGILNAIAQPSNIPPAPKKKANAMSRTSPNIREATVSIAICRNPFTICTYLHHIPPFCNKPVLLLPG